MTRGEEKQKKGEGKGFAGLSSLVSDVDATLPPAAKAEPTSSAPTTERPAPQAAQPQPSQPHQTYQEPAQPSSSGLSGGKWVLGTAAVIGVLWLIGQSDKSSTSPAPADSPPVQTATPSYSPPAEPQAPSRLKESMPPVGQDLVFSKAQIRYCLAEDVRMEGAKSALNNYIDSDVSRFNAMVADYNSRCGNFRYRSGALESARGEIEPYRSQLQAEGRSRFQERSSANVPPPADVPRSLSYGQAITPQDVLGSQLPEFTNYPSAKNYQGPRAPVMLVEERDHLFRTRIRKTESYPVNFAGEYVLSTWGCGLGCLTGVAVNARTGAVVWLPGYVCCWKSGGENVKARSNSRLLILGGVINEEGVHGAHFYELINDSFVHLYTAPLPEN